MEKCIQIAAEFNIAKKCELGLITFSANYTCNKAKNYSYLQLSNNLATITFSSVRQSNELPRQAIFRKNLAVSNQLSFLEINEDVQDEHTYFILTHKRSVNLNQGFFPLLQIGIPSQEYGYWENLYNISDLTRLPYVSEESRHISREHEITYKEEIEETIKAML